MATTLTPRDYTPKDHTMNASATATVRTIAPPVTPSSTALRPLDVSDVTLTGGFWGTRQQLNHDAIIPHALYWENKVGWIDNFVHTLAGDIADHHQGRQFADSDVYKLLEAMTWEAARSGDTDMDAEVDRIARTIAAVQREDGYLNTQFDNPGQDPRYSDLEWGHELYNYGHLLQAAVSRLRTGHTADDTLVAVSIRVADHVCEAFSDAPDAIHRVGGHPEIELGLAEFGRELDEPRYIEQAKLFVDRRGHGTLREIEFGRKYFQDDTPIRQADNLRGHAVRALYLTAGAIDVAVETGDQELFDVCKLQYDNALARRTYITGGMGSHHQDEAFGDDFELPPDRSYCESCASIASIMTAWRIMLATGDMSYGDIIERTLFNMLATSTADDGRHFFYANTLHQRVPTQPMPEDEFSLRAEAQLRAPWFEVSCCPTNISRTIATLGGYIATTTDAGVQVHQYLPGRIVAGDLTLDVDTAYPNDGDIALTVAGAPSSSIELSLRIPAWADGATVNGETVKPGTHVITRQFAEGEVISLHFPMDARVIEPDFRIDAVRGCVAVERGPLVLCAESVDLPDGMDVGQFTVAAPVTLGVGDDGRTTISVSLIDEGATNPWPYSPSGLESDAKAGQTFELPLTPYYHWANRGSSTMRVWMPVASS